MRLLYITPEMPPFAKTGGLADVMGALPRELDRRGHEVRVFLPALSAEPAQVAPLPPGAGRRCGLEARQNGGAPGPIHRPPLSARTTRGDGQSAHALVTIHDVPVEHLPRLARANLARASAAHRWASATQRKV